MYRVSRYHVVAVRPTLVSLAAVALSGCQVDTVTYEAEAVGAGWIVARADYDAQTCTVMFIDNGTVEDGEGLVSGIYMEATEEFSNAHVRWVREVAWFACGTDSTDGESLGTEGAGVVRFGDIFALFSADGSLLPGEYGVRSLWLDAEVGGVRFYGRVEVETDGY